MCVRVRACVRACVCVCVCVGRGGGKEGTTIQPANHTRRQYPTRVYVHQCVRHRVYQRHEARATSLRERRRRRDRSIIGSKRVCSIKRTKRLRRCRYRTISPCDDTRELTRGITSQGRRGRLVVLTTIYRQQQQQ